MSCDTALAFVMACVTVRLQVSVGGSLLLVSFPGGKSVKWKHGYLNVNKKYSGQNKDAIRLPKQNLCLLVVQNVEKEPCHPN